LSSERLDEARSGSRINNTAPRRSAARSGDVRRDRGLKIALSKRRINSDKSYRKSKIDPKSKRMLSAKTINNVLTALDGLGREWAERPDPKTKKAAAATS
jgi:hypothetical protein